MNPNEIPTRHELIETLQSLGVTGGAAGVIIRESSQHHPARRVAGAVKTGLERNTTYVSSAVEIAQAEAKRLFGIWSTGWTYQENHLPGLAALLCLLDCAGGENLELAEGSPTERIPYVRLLRPEAEHPIDDDAWNAAIREAAELLVPGGKLFADKWGRLGITNYERGMERHTTATFQALQLTGQKLIPWARTVAREGLLFSCGLGVWLTGLPICSNADWPGYIKPIGYNPPPLFPTASCPTEAWAILVNWLKQQYSNIHEDRRHRESSGYEYC